MVIDAPDFSEELLLVEKCFSDGYQCVIKFGRDENASNYCVELDKNNHGFSRSEIERTLPAGQIRKDALTWRSFFGIPFKTKDHSSWIAIGVAKIVKHETRVAYPTSRAFIFDFEDLSAREKLVLGIGKICGSIKPKSKSKPVSCPVLNTGIYRVNSKTPEEHIYEEIETLGWAIREYSKGKKVYFRTLLFAQEELGSLQDISRIIVVPGFSNFPLMDIPEPLKELENGALQALTGFFNLLSSPDKNK
jgi:hypothetical protein